MNKLISIGYLGIKKCYLNLNLEEAISRYCKSDNITRDEFDDSDVTIHEFEFNDTFGAYDIWDEND